MSIAALALRYLTILTLKGQILAGDKITDSPVDPLDGKWEKTAEPMIAVFTGEEAKGSAIMTISAAADAFVAIGPAPNAATGPRRLIRAGADLDVIVETGDRLAWVLA